MNKIKKGDDVIVITGKDKGKRGNVMRVLDNGRIMVDGINIVKKHVRPNPQAGETGGILEQEAALDISNVSLYDAASGKASRVGVKVLEDGKKVRVYKTSGEVIDV
ncbi:50S ribosomal protein L24 [bacterium BMS3Bbin11]|nr:50S ribosomal protein L24 [bacterium BMS3Abin11]GBE45814.1 50S ribosomal protein L24 [bacterium BMS3Bbin11]GMT39297.1 MAG: 50S ribosomal protein L24 [bacterium]HDH09264.1 50S ribosomal protein L24 [Gammaproteobacteria bacterium]HDH15950.1 50S ribosomal protein L24 [Gammaproteobacteria bacterium]